MRFSRLLATTMNALLFGAIFGLMPVISSGMAKAKDVKIGELVIETPWSRATPGSAKVGAGYLAIVNVGDKDDMLKAASSPIAERVEIHTTTLDGGVMRMRKVDGGLELKAQEVTELKPGGLHLMFIGLKKPIVKGEAFPVKLTFATAGTVDLEFVAADIGATRPPGGEIPGTTGSQSGVSAGSNSGAPERTSGGSSSGGEPKGSH